MRHKRKHPRRFCSPAEPVQSLSTSRIGYSAVLRRSYEDGGHHRAQYRYEKLGTTVLEQGG